MPQNRRCFWSTAILLSVLIAGHSHNAGLGFSQTPDFDSEEFKHWKENLQPYQYWYNDQFSQRNKQNFECQVQVEILPSGKIEWIKLAKSSGFADLDLSCLASFAERGPYDAMPEMTKKYPPLPGGLNDDNTAVLPENIQGPYRPIFIFNQVKTPMPLHKKRSHSNHKMDIATPQMHIIPTGIGLFYPGLFTTDELSSNSNIISVNAQTDLNEIANIFLNEWQNFIINHKNASREEIKNKADFIKEKYGELLEVGK